MQFQWKTFLGTEIPFLQALNEDLGIRMHFWDRASFLSWLSENSLSPSSSLGSPDGWADSFIGFKNRLRLIFLGRTLEHEEALSFSVQHDPHWLCTVEYADLKICTQDLGLFLWHVLEAVERKRIEVSVALDMVQLFLAEEEQNQTVH